jgi:DNA-binding CsgD family transcriptional regulator
MVLISDPEAKSGIPISVLSGLYGLTPAEARVVAALIAGRSLTEHARECGVSVETVRSHLKRAMAKTETRRQSELVRLIATGPLGAAAS